jgi:hypothetical protein
MKKTIVLLCLSFLLTASLYSQNIQYDYKVTYTHDASGVAADIIVTAKSGEPDFTYCLMTNDPVHGKILMTSEPTKKTSYTFKGVKPGKYFLKIEDSTGNMAGKTVNVNENEN